VAALRARTVYSSRPLSRHGKYAWASWLREGVPHGSRFE
jgi:hypothetical protein